jgi:hypothetical protein
MTFVFDQPEGDSKTERKPSKAERKLRKEAERAAETRPLDPWERYRALTDLVDHMVDVIEMADRRTRFALVVLGTLNAANVLIALQADVVGASALDPLLVRGYVGCYLLLSLYFLVHAVIALRPRLRQMGRSTDASYVDGLPGLRLVDDILAHKPDDFYELWRTAEIGALNRELAIQVHLLARTTSEKFAALRQVYAGVLILIVLTTMFVAALGLHAILPGLV